MNLFQAPDARFSCAITDPGRVVKGNTGFDGESRAGQGGQVPVNRALPRRSGLSGGVPPAGPGPLQDFIRTRKAVDHLDVTMSPDQVEGRLVQLLPGNGTKGVGRERHLGLAQYVPVVLLHQPGHNVLQPTEGGTHVPGRLDQSPALVGVQTRSTPIAFTELGQGSIFLHSPTHPCRDAVACDPSDLMRTYVRIWSSAP